MIDDFRGYIEEKKGGNVDAGNLDQFMDPAERQRAQTYYMQVQ